MIFLFHHSKFNLPGIRLYGFFIIDASSLFDLLMSFDFSNFVLIIIFYFLISNFFSPYDSGHCTSQHSKGAQTRDYVSLLRNQLSLLEELHTTFLLVRQTCCSEKFAKTCLLGSSCLMVIPEHG
jgi:hypothetical protein